MAEETLRKVSAAQIRAQLEGLVVADLLGPAGGPEEEVAEARVTERYIAGMLAPRHTTSAPEQADALALAGQAPTEEGEPEPDAPPNATLFPSAYGLTFTVDGAVETLTVTASWGRYERRRSTLADEGEARTVWGRVPCGGTLTVPLVEGDLDRQAPDPEQPDVLVEGRARRLTSDGRRDWIVTLFLVNRQTEPKRSRDEAWLFQVKLAVTAPDGAPAFRTRPNHDHDADMSSPDKLEAALLAMAYRDEAKFAVGHGIAVDAEAAPADPHRATRLVTTAVPGYEVPPTVAPDANDVPALAGVCLEMEALADAAPASLSRLLSPLADAYDDWIGEQERRLGDPAARLGPFTEVAKVALERARRAAARIRAGIDLVGADPDAADAFRFANRAMALQRLHTRAAEARRRDPTLGADDAIDAARAAETPTWRPFQLAFVLLNLPGLSDPLHPERGKPGLADLLWFPTGGGKTEAYLGLTAYTLALRRLQPSLGGYDASEGVAVVMRYTLRLLTIQQFQRATALICACEALRRDTADRGDRRWGTTPFRIGLWVGMRATPNTTEDAERWVKQRRKTARWTGGVTGSPAQLTVCPWCGAQVDERADIVVERDLRRTLLYCGDATGTCLFTAKQSPQEGIPAVVVDEEIYRLLPALLIGTVDKFAQLPWRGPVQTLFGRVAGRCERHGFRTPDDADADRHPRHGAHPAARTVPAGPLRPPDLIVQDELHLIAGPLGSMVGLYETAVDRLATWTLDGHDVRPKVIASTATVRRAAHQAHQVFARGLEVFPPAGLDAADSFFARQRSPSDALPGRRYRGICAHGRRFKAVLIRVFVAQLAAAQTLYEQYGAAADPYMTLVGYFNSLRELGGMRRLVDDDVAARLRRIDARGLSQRRLAQTEELTSRIGSGDIPRTLERLAVPFDPAAPRDVPRPIDVLLATNMVSVGVDVPRLGVMIVGGQPKSTAEYIQATSRVGRASPGVVWTVYNWARPRDLSHYETHPHYHATFYQHVEALTVTPFAPRALDRGLTALLVALARQEQLDWNPERAAQTADTASPRGAAIVAAVRDRAAAVTGRAEVSDDVVIAARHRLDLWQGEQAITGRTLAYRGKADGMTKGLLAPPGVTAWDEWTCLTSLRDVEPGIRLLLTDDDLGEASAPPYDPVPDGQETLSDGQEEPA
ncbi:MAG: DISARM system helicase DrmA [Egibacteraceae bacterium]